MLNFLSDAYYWAKESLSEWLDRDDDLDNEQDVFEFDSDSDAAGDLFERHAVNGPDEFDWHDEFGIDGYDDDSDWDNG